MDAKFVRLGSENGKIAHSCQITCTDQFHITESPIIIDPTLATSAQLTIETGRGPPGYCSLMLNVQKPIRNRFPGWPHSISRMNINRVVSNMWESYNYCLAVYGAHR